MERGQGRLRQIAQRLVQLPQRVLSGAGATLRVAGHGLEQDLSDGQRTFRVRHGRKKRSRASTTINADYAKHSAAARALAEQMFDARKVLGAMLERVGV